MKQTLRVASLLSLACAAMVAFSGFAHAQQVDFGMGLTTMLAPAASQADSNHSPQSLDGGAYPVFSGDVLFHKNFGVQAELAWKGSQANYVPGGYNQPFRPLFYDFNAIWAPKLTHRVYAELMGGIGAESTRFYTASQICNYYTCTNYVSSNHFMEHFGGGLKLYAYHNFFVRPEAHLYLINNNVEFSSAHAVRYGVSIGYTFGR